MGSAIVSTLYSAMKCVIRPLSCPTTAIFMNPPVASIFADCPYMQEFLKHGVPKGYKPPCGKTIYGNSPDREFQCVQAQVITALNLTDADTHLWFNVDVWEAPDGCNVMALTCGSARAGTFLGFYDKISKTQKKDGNFLGKLIVTGLESLPEQVVQVALKATWNRQKNNAMSHKTAHKLSFVKYNRDSLARMKNDKNKPIPQGWMSRRIAQITNGD